MNIISKQLATIIIFATLNSAFATGQHQQYEKHANIIQTVKKFIQQHIKRMHKGEFTISIGRIDPRHKLRRCGVPLETQITGNNFRGSSMTVSVRCTKPSPWLLYVPGKVAIFKAIFVARQTMTRGHRITEDDLQMTRRDVTRLQYGYIDRKKDIIGKITRRVVFANTVLKSQMLGLPLLVRRGQTVILMAESNGIQVRMSGKALGSGPVGHSIRVRNLSSRRIVEGIVVSTGVVKINF